MPEIASPNSNTTRDGTAATSSNALFTDRSLACAALCLASATLFRHMSAHDGLPPVRCIGGTRLAPLLGAELSGIEAPKLRVAHKVRSAGGLLLRRSAVDR